MNESEVRKIFLIIVNTYNNFDHDDDKVAVWQDLLREISFEQAQRNLRRFLMNPENKFPPHPGVLAETFVQRSEGPYIPNAAETKLMMQKQARDPALAIPIPDGLREELKQHVERNQSE